jgi:hypothetical protein
VVSIVAPDVVGGKPGASIEKLKKDVKEAKLVITDIETALSSPGIPRGLIGQAAEALPQVKDDIGSIEEQTLLLEQALVGVNAELDKTTEQERLDSLEAGIKNVADKVLAVAENLNTYGGPLLAAFYNYKNTLDQADLAREKRINDEKQRRYKKQLDGRLISQSQFDKKSAEAQEQYDKKDREVKRKQAERDKKQRIFETILNTATGIAKAVSQSPLTFGLPFSAFVAATGILQLAAIKKEPLPELAKGGLLRRGPKHNSPSRGLQVVNPETGTIEALVERNEAIMSSATMDDSGQYTVSGTPAQISSALNEANGGNGWAGGAVLRRMGQPAWLNAPQPRLVANMPKMYAAGGLIGADGGAGGADNRELLVRLISEVAGQRADMANWNRVLKAYVTIKDIRAEEKLYDDAVAASGF